MAAALRREADRIELMTAGEFKQMFMGIPVRVSPGMPPDKVIVVDPMQRVQIVS